MEMDRFAITKQYKQLAHDMDNLRCEMQYEIKKELKDNLHFDGSIDFMDYDNDYTPIVSIIDKYFINKQYIEQVMVNDCDEIWITLENKQTIAIDKLQFHELFELYNSIAAISELLGDW